MDWRREARRALRAYPDAKKRDTPEARTITNAVEFALKMQDVYPNAAERRRMVELVYFRRSHTLEGAAAACHYTRETIQKWNIELLSAVYVGLIK